MILVNIPTSSQLDHNSELVDVNLYVALKIAMSGISLNWKLGEAARSNKPKDIEKLLAAGCLLYFDDHH